MSVIELNKVRTKNEGVCDCGTYSSRLDEHGDCPHCSGTVGRRKADGRFTEVQDIGLARRVKAARIADDPEFDPHPPAA